MVGVLLKGSQPWGESGGRNPDGLALSGHPQLLRASAIPSAQRKGHGFFFPVPLYFPGAG